MAHVDTTMLAVLRQRGAEAPRIPDFSKVEQRGLLQDVLLKTDSSGRELYAGAGEVVFIKKRPLIAQEASNGSHVCHAGGVL